MHEVSWVIVYLETLASDAVAVWQHPYKCDALSFHNKITKGRMYLLSSKKFTSLLPNEQFLVLKKNGTPFALQK